MKRKDVPQDYKRVDHESSLPFTIEQVKRIFDYYENGIQKSYSPLKKFSNLRDLTIIKMLLYLGNRPKEVYGANLNDLDMGARVFNIRAENNKTRSGAIQKIPKVLYDDLLFYLNNREKIFPQSKILFPSTWNSNEIVDRGTLIRSFTRALKGAELKKANFKDAQGNVRLQYNLYSLRKTYATLIYNKVNDVLLVSKLLRHKDTRTAPKHYIKVMNETMEKAVENVFGNPKVENNGVVVGGIDEDLKGSILDFIEEQKKINRILLGKTAQKTRKVNNSGYVSLYLGDNFRNKKVTFCISDIQIIKEKQNGEKSDVH